MASEFIFKEAPFDSCHASTIAEAKDGALVAAWFGGTREGDNDVGIWLSRKEIRKRWTPPVEVARDPDAPCWNPVLHQMRKGPLLLFYKVGNNPRDWTGWLMRSKDGGKSWSEPEMLPAGILGPVKNKPIELKNGTLVCGTSEESYGAWGCWVEITRDQGKTWSRHGPINVPGKLHGIIQPAVFRTRGKRLRMLCRSRGMGRIAVASSKDGGLTWSDASLTDLPNNNSGLDAVRLKDKRILLIYNHTEKGRTPLNLAISSDRGKTWAPGLVLEKSRGEFSYPAIIQAKDGTIHAVYTWKRRRIKHVILTLEALTTPEPAAPSGPSTPFE